MAGRRRTTSKRDKVAGRMPSHRGTVYADGVTTQIDRTGKITAVATHPPSGNGSVTSVALTASPSSIFNVGGSPVTTSGTLALSMDDQNANEILAGPTSGADATPNFRPMVTNDLPDSVLGAGTFYNPLSVTFDAKGRPTAWVEDPFNNGEGLVFGRSSTIRSITSMSYIYYAPAPIDKFYILTSATNGILNVIDPVTKEHYAIATHTSKALVNAIYSPNSGLLMVNYGTNSMSVNPTTGAAVTTGIVASFQLGGAIRPSDGVLYGGNASSGQIERINTITDTAGADIATTNLISSSSKKAVTYCDPNDSIYVLTGVKVTRISCAANVETAIISPAGLVGGTGGGCAVYGSAPNKIYACVGGVKNLVQIDPGTDAQEASYPFPPGAAAGGSNGMVILGRYLYVGGQTTTTPGEILIFDTQEEEFIGCLNSDNGGVTPGHTMDGRHGVGIDDTFLVTLTTSASNWIIFGGRY